MCYSSKRVEQSANNAGVLTGVGQLWYTCQGRWIQLTCRVTTQHFDLYPTQRRGLDTRHRSAAVACKVFLGGIHGQNFHGSRLGQMVGTEPYW